MITEVVKPTFTVENIHAMYKGELLKPVGANLPTPKEKAEKLPPQQSSIDAVMADVMSGGGSTATRASSQTGLSKHCVARVFRFQFDLGLIKRMQDERYGEHAYYMIDDDSMPSPKAAVTESVFNCFESMGKTTKEKVRLKLKISKYHIKLAVDQLLKSKRLNSKAIGMSGGVPLCEYWPSIVSTKILD